MSDVFDIGAADHSMSSDTGHTRSDIDFHFYYDDPDSMRRLDECMRAPDVKSVLWEFSQWLRYEIKYLDRDDETTLHEVQDKLWETCKAYQVDPWEE